MRALFLLPALLSVFYLTTAHGKDIKGKESHPAAKGRMSGWEAFSELQNGNTRFFEGRAKHPNQDPATREGLAGGQKPHTILVSCSDSRVPPEEIFDQGLGDIFSVRLAGNTATTEGIASIEYAIAHLGPKLLVVMGHESCGAVGAAVGSKSGVSNGSESLDVLITNIRSHLSATAVSSAASDKTYREGVKDNVSATIRELASKSEIIRDAIAKDGLVVAQAIYSLKTGRVEFWDMGSKLAIVGQSDGPVVGSQVVHEEVILDAVPKKVKAKSTH
jgi:carbonic anhydrase